MPEFLPKLPINHDHRPGPPSAWHRAGWFTLSVIAIMLVGDGWSGRPIGLRHQLLLLPFTGTLLLSIWKLLFRPGAGRHTLWTPRSALLLCAAFELLTLVLFRYEARHFAAFGYHLGAAQWLVFLSVLVVGLAIWRWEDSSWTALSTVVVAVYTLGVLLAIGCFPLNYLRSDMLPVISWANTQLLHHISPYTTMYVGGRVYDFPYLPGMLMVYLPFVALHVDVRFASILSIAAIGLMLSRAAQPQHRSEVACLIGLFVLDPFLQYRHDLYLQPHWLTLVGAFVLMQRGRWLWGAFVLGLGMAIYQFSWIVLPFVLLNALWRRGWSEAIRQVGAAAAGALLLAGPFLHSAFARISNNTVGQWARFDHAIAEPMNLSWWITFAIHPDKLLRLQAGLMVAIYAGCVLRRRCTTLEDTLRWSVVALAVFVLCNSFVDGYFYLMLLVVMLLFTVVANGWLAEPVANLAQG